MLRQHTQTRTHVTVIITSSSPAGEPAHVSRVTDVNDGQAVPYLLLPARDRLLPKPPDEVSEALSAACCCAGAERTYIRARETLRLYCELGPCRQTSR